MSNVELVDGSIYVIPTGSRIADAIIKSTMLPFGLDSILTFGDHIGEQIEDMIYDHPFYIEYLVNDGYPFTVEALQLIISRGIV